MIKFERFIDNQLIAGAKEVTSFLDGQREHIGIRALVLYYGYMLDQITCGILGVISFGKFARGIVDKAEKEKS